jgi:hypothetical protein
MSGKLVVPNVNGRLYIDGNSYTSLQGAFAACPAAGCIIDMTGNSTTSALTLGTFDPGTTPVMILLGPYNYTVTQITVRTDLAIIGSGKFASGVGTQITQATNNVAPFVLGSTLYPGNVAVGARFEHFTLTPAASSTTDGFSMVALTDSNGKGGGLWYSTFSDLSIASGAAGFGRNAIRLDSATNPGTAPNYSTDQFDSFRDVVAYRGTNGPPVLMITGAFTGQMSFENCEFDGNIVGGAPADTGATNYNIRIDSGGSTVLYPYSIVMRNVTSQGASGTAGATSSSAIYLGGVNSFSCFGCHFENDNGAITEVLGPSGHGDNMGVLLDSSYMSQSVGQNGGTSGFIVSMDNNSTLELRNTAYHGTPDNLCIGTGCTNFLRSSGNINALSGIYEPWNDIFEQFQCTMAAGACTAVTLTHIYTNGHMACTATPSTSGSGVLSVAITIGSIPSTYATATVSSSNGADARTVWGTCMGHLSY